MTKNLHKFWLKLASATILAFAPIFLLGSQITTTEPARLTLDILNFPIDGLQTFDTDAIRFLSALTGGFLFGWGILVFCLSIWVYDKAPELVRKSVLTSLIVWFITDSLGSFLAGAISNVLFNVIVLLFASGPLWFSIKRENS
jgi:hypothetical protein